MRRVEHDKTGDAAEWVGHPYTQKTAAKLRVQLAVTRRALINKAAQSTDPELQRLHEEYINILEMVRFFTGRKDVQDNE